MPVKESNAQRSPLGGTSNSGQSQARQRGGRRRSNSAPPPPAPPTLPPDRPVAASRSPQHLPPRPPRPPPAAGGGQRRAGSRPTRPRWGRGRRRQAGARPRHARRPRDETHEPFPPWRAWPARCGRAPGRCSRSRPQAASWAWCVARGPHQSSAAGECQLLICLFYY